MLRVAAVPILQAAVAAAIAWEVATRLVGHERPFFAPVSSVVALALTGGQRNRRAVELVAGVTIGILVADVLVHEIGTGPLTIALVVVLAMVATVMLGGGPLVVAQATNSAILVATIQAPHSGIFNGSRAIDALIGSAIGVGVHALVLPLNPVTTAARSVQPMLDEMAAVLADVSAALRARDHEAIRQALIRARGLDDLHDDFHAAMQMALETARVAPPRRRARRPLTHYATAEVPLDLALRNVRVLARAVLRAIELDDHVPEEVAVGIDDLAAAVRHLGPGLSDPEQERMARDAALRAGAGATLGLEQTANLSVSVIVGQVRSTAADLLRGMGMTPVEAREAVRGAAADLATNS